MLVAESSRGEVRADLRIAPLDEELDDELDDEDDEDEMGDVAAPSVSVLVVGVAGIEDEDDEVEQGTLDTTAEGEVEVEVDEEEDGDEDVEVEVEVVEAIELRLEVGDAAEAFATGEADEVVEVDERDELLSDKADELSFSVVASWVTDWTCSEVVMVGVVTPPLIATGCCWLTMLAAD